MTSVEPSLVDAHFHLDLLPDPPRIAVEAEASHIHVIAVTNAPSVFFHTLALSTGKQFIHPAVGLHPELVKSHGHERLAMWECLSQTRFVGEVGLDYVTTDTTNRSLQREVFSEILSHCADYGNKILSVHSRRSSNDVIQMIGPDYPGIVILHWFSGSKRDLEQAVKFGFYFSVNPSMIHSKTGGSLIERIPLNRILTETDSPFVRVKGQAALPYHVAEVVAGIAETLGHPIALVRRQVCDNFQRILERGM